MGDCCVDARALLAVADARSDVARALGEAEGVASVTTRTNPTDELVIAAINRARGASPNGDDFTLVRRVIREAVDRGGDNAPAVTVVAHPTDPTIVLVTMPQYEDVIELTFEVKE